MFDYTPVEELNALWIPSKRYFKVYRMRCSEDTYTHYCKEGHELLEHFEGWVLAEYDLIFHDGISQDEYEMLVHFVDTAEIGASINLYQWIIIYCGDRER